MDELSAIQSIANIGFPAAMCLWFMYQTDNRLQKLTEAVNNLNSSLTTIRRLGK
jgi:hypothetical protein